MKTKKRVKVARKVKMLGAILCNDDVKFSYSRYI